MTAFDDLDRLAATNVAVQCNDDLRGWRVVCVDTCDGRDCDLAPLGEPCAGVVDLYATTGLDERVRVHIGVHDSYEATTR